MNGQCSFGTRSLLVDLQLLVEWLNKNVGSLAKVSDGLLCVKH